MVASNGTDMLHSTYQQYKKNTSTLIRWIVTTASSCTAPTPPKPINNNPKHKKKAAKAARSENARAFPSELSTTKLVSLSTAIAEEGQPVPDAIYALFDSVIGARTAAHEIWKALSVSHPDPDIEMSNERHWAFIVALQSAFDALGGAVWRKCHEEDRNAKKKARAEERLKALARLKSEAGPEGVDPSFDFMNKFDGLDVQSLPIEDEEALEHLATQDATPPTEVTATDQVAATVKNKRKGKSSRISTEPLSNYKVKSETEAYFAVCFFVRDVIHLRRYMRNIWRQVGLGQLHCAVAGALSNMAVGMVRSLQYELAMDYPACTHFREIINQLVRDGNYEVIGATASNTIEKSNGASKQLARKPKGDMGAIEESLLLTTHNDLVSFITDYRKNRNGKPSPTYAKISWNPNFRDTSFTLAKEMTTQNIRKWKSDYTVSWLYDLVNTYATGRLIKDKSHMQNPEKLDWDFEGSGKCEWTNRPLWGPMDFARDMTVLAMQKPGAPIESELKPHQILQLQIAVDSMFCAKRWVTQDVPPIDCFGSTSSTLVWDFANDILEIRRFREQWAEATELLLEEFKKDRERKGDPTEWSHPIMCLDILLHEANLLGATPLDIFPEAPRSLFSKSSKNGLWLYSPYLCGTGMVEMLNMSYDWGTKCWDRSGYMQSFLHLYSMLLQNGHVKKPIDTLERLIEVFKDDIFRGRQRPTKNFFDSFKLTLDIRAQYLGDFTKLRRRKAGGTQAEGSIFRGRGKPDDHSLYTKQSKLFALSQANWLVSKLDRTKFPTLVNPKNSATDLLDALKSDLTEDITGRAPVTSLNYNLLLRTVSVIYSSLDEATKDMPEAKAILDELLDGSKTTAPGLHDKILSLAFSSPTVTIQDTRNERLDSPILARMGSHLSKTWDRMGPQLERSLVYGQEAAKNPERALADKKAGKRRFLGEGAQGREFLNSEKMKELREKSPLVYEALVRATAGVQVGSCKDCEHCRKGVKIEKSEDLLGQLIKKVARD